MSTTKINTLVSYCVLPAGAQKVNTASGEEGSEWGPMAFGWTKVAYSWLTCISLPLAASNIKPKSKWLKQ